MIEQAGEWAEEPPLVDASRPSDARVYDLLLGGKDHFEADRELGRQLLEVVPDLPLWARENRRWLRRVVRWLAGEQQVGQFVDLGAGLPTEENLHQVAQAVRPRAKVVYVDIDPSVIAHGRALLVDNDYTAFVAADLTRPRQVLVDEAVVVGLDDSRPIALIEALVLHHVPDLDDARKIQAEYLDHLPSGSYVAISHACNPRDGSPAAELADAFEERLGPSFPDLRFRTPAEILTLFGDLEVLSPGLFRVSDWNPPGAPDPDAPEIDADGNFLYCAVARKR
ncbi:SAM-dependent methyltransferase [Kribbella sp. NPDC051770]|uniref:SAM-dependent methyltransferase n=1 Tax=Kribbella sp. NPDC051770 TaxID=3155413 RepID=UPI00342D738C